MQKKEITEILIQIIGSLPTPVILFDTELNLLIQSEALDKNIFDHFMIHFKNSYTKNSLFEKFLKQNNYHGYILDSDDKKISIEINLRTLIIEEVQLQYVYVQFSDVTEKIRINFEQEKMHMLQINNDKMHGLAEISAGISHEINNPLTVIMAKVQLVKNLITSSEPVNSEKIIEGLNRIHHHSERITKIIKTLKNFSRNTANDESEIVSIQSIIEDSTNLLHEQIKNKGIQIKLNISSENLNVRCVQSEITQIIVNLIKNSIDALETVRQPVIQIEINKVNAHQVRLALTDNGTGILPEVRDQIFRSFFTTKAAGSGTGLGLSLSKHLALKNNGRLFLDDQKSETSFCLELNCK